MKSKEAYQQFISHQEIPIYLSSWFLNEVCGMDHWNVCYYDIDGEVQAIWVYFIKKKAGLKYITMPTLVKYMGPFFLTKVTPEEKGRMVQKMKLMLPSTSYFYQQWEPSIQEDLINKNINLDHCDRDTFLWDISVNSEDLQSKMDSNYRRAIRKHTDQLYISMRDQHISTTEEIDLFIQLIERTMGSLNDHKLQKESIIKLILESEQRKAGKLIMLYHEEKLVGGSFTIWDSQKAYYVFAANNMEYNKWYPGVQTAWKTVHYLKENTSVSQLDFLGSSIESIARVWRKIGAVKTKYPVIEEKPSLLFSSLNKLKKNLGGK